MKDKILNIIMNLNKAIEVLDGAQSKIPQTEYLLDAKEELDALCEHLGIRR